MSLQPQAIPEPPEATRGVAQAVFRRGNRYMQVRDKLGTFYTDQDFAQLFAVRGRPGETPWRLALVLVFQFVEGLTDEQAAEAVRSRIDWKYALSLELTDEGFDASVLSEFRTRLVEGSAEMKLLDIMLEQFKQAGYVKARLIPTDSHALRPRSALQHKTGDKQYNRRAGVEGTISQAVRRTDFRHTRYISKAKTHLQHVLSAAAINLCRITDYLTNLETQTFSPIPFVSQRRTAFVALASAP